MFVRKGLFSSIGRGAAVATVVAMALTAVEPSMAQAGSAPSGRGEAVAAGTSGSTDISARRRHYGGGGAAAAAAFAGIVGTGLAIAASQNRRGYYEDSYGYYDAPQAYYGYGGGPYYGSRAYHHPGGYNNPNAYGYSSW